MGRRRKKGDAVHGWLLIDKPAGMTSSDVVNKVRYALNANRAGHSGTLDPDATGLLPVAFGEATKLLPYLEDCPKTYEFEMVMGTETSTDDASGDVIETSDIRPDRGDIERIIPEFLGEIQQVPPKVSALKIDGKRAYDLVREGIEVEIAPRPLFMHELELMDYDGMTARLSMTCGKGGYVRAIARDLARASGSLGHVLWLRRLATSGFDISDAVELSAFLESADKFAYLHPVPFARPDWSCHSLSSQEFNFVKNGRGIDISIEGHQYCFLSYRDTVIAIGRRDGAHIHVERYFPQLSAYVDSPFSN